MQSFSVVEVLYFSDFVYFLFVCFLCSFLNSCGCSTVKSKTSPQETFFHPLNFSGHRSHPSLTTRDRELVYVQEVRIEPVDLNPRPLTPQSVTLPTIHPLAGSKRSLNSFDSLDVFCLPWIPELAACSTLIME